ncbi:MAG: helix-hairpin-helix domain-containing protein [Clostridia bacterium]|nr:helix-hairpin-helix domain-containing protein [Clostridia bacterium]
MRFRLFGRTFYVPVFVKYVLIVFVAAVLIVGGYLFEKKTGSGRITPGSANTSASASGSPFKAGTPGPSETPAQEEAPTDGNDTPSDMIVVYIVGAVEKSDVYEIPAGSILNDLVAAAGGLSENADREAVNLAFTLESGMMIRVPYIDDTDKKWIIDAGLSGPSGSSGTRDPQGSGLVNINTASVSELCTLPGIGESTALKIVSYRTENGPFSSITEIMNVSGIKAARYNEIKAYITV